MNFICNVLFQFNVCYVILLSVNNYMIGWKKEILWENMYDYVQSLRMLWVVQNVIEFKKKKKSLCRK